MSGIFQRLNGFENERFTQSLYFLSLEQRILRFHPKKQLTPFAKKLHFE